uniref:Uncharacterized protein n=1 Tax=Vitis vinifera TaxID=29760 RepID=A5BEV0_VITVI|nr:hypothetical protein VITISV_007686 [Vitis vinifera]
MTWFKSWTVIYSWIKWTCSTQMNSKFGSMLQMRFYGIQGKIIASRATCFNLHFQMRTTDFAAATFMFSQKI